MLEKTIKIADKKIGEGKPVFIIAEAGINHNGKSDTAKKLVDVAYQAGVDAVKFQTFDAGLVVTKDLEMAAYQKGNTGIKQTQYGMLKKCELKPSEFKEIKSYCDKLGLIFLSTSHSNEQGIEILDELNVPAYKVGSGDLTNLPFLTYLAEKKKPIIIGTGMSNLEEVVEAVECIRVKGNDKIILLHCTTNYPCKAEDVNLKAMLTMKEKCNTIIGYSDHTEGILTPALATALGAKVIEKHFTLYKNMEGPDHKASLEPIELASMVENIRRTERVLGNGVKQPAHSEKDISKIIRKSLVAAKYIPKGSIITKDMVIIKRPCTGIKPKEIYNVIGRKAKKDIKEDEILNFKKLY